jgi:thiol:disulfide interchange protein DsbC
MTYKLIRLAAHSLLACSALALCNAGAAASGAAPQVAASATSPAASSPPGNSHQQRRVPASVVAAIKAGIAKLNPNASPVQSVAVSPIPGMYEVYVDGQLLYSDAAGQHIVVGQMIDSATHDNLTNKHLDETYRLPPNSLPKVDSIVSYKIGSGKHEMLIFEDPDCTYCKHLETELAQLKDTTVYVAMIEILGDQSKKDGHAIACAVDTAAAWRLWMNQGTLPEAPVPESCAGDAAVARNLQLAQKLGVNSTPTFYFSDGSRSRGVIQAAVLQKRLEDIAAGVKSD